jgi:NifU-like protein involved in Fe-S cluster formation
VTYGGDALPPQVRRLFAALRYAGRLEPPTAAELRDAGSGRIVMGVAGEVESGTRVQFQWRMQDGNIVGARFLAYGCPYTLATCEWLAAQLVGRALPDAWPGGPEDWARALGTPLDRLGRLLIIEDALRATAKAAVAARGGLPVP